MAHQPRNSRDASGRMDYWLFGAVLVMLCVGLLMVLSASGVMAERLWEDQYHFFRRHLVYVAIGLAALLAAAWVSRRVVYKLIYVWLGLACLSLAATMSPWGTSAGGAARWVDLGLVSFQPLEVAKVALVLYLAYFFSRKQEQIKSFSVGFLPPVLVTSVFGLLLLLQPDYGGTVYIAALFFFMSLVGGARLKYLIPSFVFAGFAGALLVWQEPYRVRRWLAFLDPFQDAQDAGYQLVQSLYALGSGRLWGVGLGASRQKLLFLPEAHNDFILAVLGEELGFLGVSIVFTCLAVVLWRSLAIALGQQDMQDRLTAYGLGLILVLGGLLNAAVVLGAVPPKGTPMPFISYGGTQLVVSCLCAGVLLNISRQERG
ncbi:putative lipid II flippase FtsW [Desulfohalobium retbaense]|uniref:Probable peptidoglycan glycosyltransferase FtsW n=1 Tax=Desulfohalobium retbaense (strain ATCC 49708 / DSM 5692 / JCM 16813 / HR100) TaxID=485915 RepID=C8X0U0_DESRD|nr:putative lipid II flippase FtsW [Desulfohalobium retbaense]ACV68037.1 cell division protein FtsW [Desulfohalobium retbaense DSM 5692]